MSRGTLSGWLVLSAVAVSAAFATTRGDRGSGNDAANGNAANNAAAAANAGAKGANPAGKKKKRNLDQDLVTALYRVGLQAESLTAAGVSAQATGDVVARVKSWLGQNPTAVADADTRVYNATTNRDQLVRKVQSGLGTKDDVTALDAAVTEYAAATAAQATTLGGMSDAGTADVSSDVRTTLSAMHANWLAWRLPLQYLVKNRGQEDWVALRDALDNERVSASEGDDPDPTCQSLLSQVRADSAVSTAKTNLDTKFADVETAWEVAATAN